MKKPSILLEAEKIVNGARQKDYGSPSQNWKHVALIFNAITGYELTPSECALMLVAVKFSREMFNHKRDNLVDVCGYTEILSQLSEGK